MDTKLARVYYIPVSYWKDFAAMKILAKAAKVPVVTAKQWLHYQTSYLSDLSSPTALHSSPKYST